ncbi:hypothetical protein [Streptomyces sp. NPDC047706]|uniref:hypothetical protein n=1 Tax=Streptomyces sp. NPDC047706 TaxID=3365486 RepID=UPI0037202853
MLLLKGDQDSSVKTAATKQAVHNPRAAGTHADFMLYPGEEHSVRGPRSQGGSGTDASLAPPQPPAHATLTDRGRVPATSARTLKVSG